MKHKSQLIALGLILIMALLTFKAEAGFLTQTHLAVNAEDINARYKIWFPCIKNGKKPADQVGPIGGTFTSVLTDPVNKNFVYGGHYHAGLFISFDQGATWYERNKGLPNKQIQSMAVHPRHPEIWYAGTYGSGIYLSRDSGKNWESWNGGILDNHIVYDIEIDPTNPSNVYAASRISGSLVGYVSRSTDAGKTWSIVYRGDWFDTPDYFYDIEVNPGGNNTVFFTAHEHGFYRSLDNGLSFAPVNSGINDLSARGIAINKANPNLVLGVVWKGSGAFRSWNNGSGWQQARAGFPADVRIMTVVENPTTALPNRFFVATKENGLYVTENAGDSWVHRGMGNSFINDVAISYFEPQTWYLATQDKGMVRTKDGGASWSTIMSDLRLYSITGMQSLSWIEDAIFVAIHGMGIYRYQPSDGAWIEANDGLTDLDVTGLYNDGMSLWASTDAGLWQLKEQIWQEVKMPVSQTTDSRLLKTWQAIRLGKSDETSLDFIDPVNTIETGVDSYQNLSVTGLLTFQDQILVGSTDGLWTKTGSGWKRFGLDGQLVMAIEKHASDDSLWVSACLPDDDCKVYRYENGTFNRQGEGLKNARINQFLSTGSALFAATDVGIHSWNNEYHLWQLKADVPEGVLSLAQNPQSDTMIIAGSQGFVLKSIDFGESWQKIETENDWNYPFIALNYGENVKLLLGTIESGAFLMEIDPE